SAFHGGLWRHYRDLGFLWHGNSTKKGVTKDNTIIQTIVFGFSTTIHSITSTSGCFFLVRSINYERHLS
ncbi:hypothetical protein MOE62_13000, partial [Bacillus inaquosorum]|uniref:hypothetical protein n=1 Tax=Bacillus inaquosorum TaxID=483913 RepID=UPI00228262CC